MISSWLCMYACSSLCVSVYVYVCVCLRVCECVCLYLYALLTVCLRSNGSVFTNGTLLILHSVLSSSDCSQNNHYWFYHSSILMWQRATTSHKALLKIGRQQQSVQINASLFSFFFCRGHATYKSPCRSVGRSVRPLVRLLDFAFFAFFGHFKGWKVCIWACPCPNHNCPCPNHYCPCPNHYCPCPNQYCPCPSVRDSSSRVYGLVWISISKLVKYY